MLITKKINHNIFLFFAFYFVINLFYLDSFPFVHADESWLASLSRAIIEEKSFAAVEDFFILTERHPHALKILFHSLQIPFVKNSFSIISVRIISVFFSVINIYFFYLLLKKNIKSKKIVLIILTVLSFDIQYLYISRFARQEIIILTILTVNLYLLFNSLTFKKITIASVLNGLAIGIHPNSFFIFTASIMLLTAHLFLQKRNIIKYLKYIIYYVLIVFFFAVIFIYLSLLIDNNFFHNYLKFGSEHGVTDIFIIKILKLKRFYFKMFNRISGTYFLPDLRFQFIIFAASLIFLTISSFTASEHFKKTVLVIFFLAGINAAYILIGKYSPPSVVFIFPACWFAAALAADRFKRNIYIVLILILGININNSVNEISNWNKSRYSRYMTDISKYIDTDENVFASINTAFFMNYRQLASYNDIEMFNKADLDFEKYIKKNNIRYIIYTDELDIIFNERPLWNDLYGNIYPYYYEINNFIKEKCVLTGEVSDFVYPVRITYFMNRKKYKAKIYKVTAF